MLCDCPGRPMCEWYDNHGCGAYADWSVYQPAWPPRRERFKSMCEAHYQIYKEAWTKPMPGIDRPAHANDDWRPSLSDHIRLSCMAMRFEERQKAPHPEPAHRAQAPGFEFRREHECSLHAIEQWIKRNGYASFWSGSVLVILRDGRHIANYSKYRRTLHTDLGAFAPRGGG